MRVLITGSSTGIGRALTEHLLARGHHVWGLARSDQSAFASGHAAAFRASRVDVSLWPEVDAVAQSVATHWESLDGLVCCAGSQGAIGPALGLDPVAWSETVRTNLDGTYFPLRAFYPLLRKASGRAKAICFSGGGATKPRPNFSAYGVAKTAIVRLVETLAEELQGERIDLNAVAPGAIVTRLTDEVIARGPAIAGEAEYRSAVAQKASGGGSLAGAIGLVEWLLSEQSDGITGRLLSAPWDPWRQLARHRDALAASDVFTLRRIVPRERGLHWEPS